MIYKHTQDLLKKAEEVVIGYKSKKKLFKKVDSSSFEKISNFIVSGNCSMGVKAFLVTLSLWIILFLIVGVDSSLSLPQKLIANGMIAFILGIVTAPFTLPSTIMAKDIKCSDIENLKDEISKKRLTSRKLQVIKGNLPLIESTFKSKLIISNWIIASLWAVYVYCFAKCFIDNVIDGKPIKLYTLLAFCAYAFFIWLVFMLKRRFQETGERVFMTLLFALNESIIEEKHE